MKYILTLLLVLQLLNFEGIINVRSSSISKQSTLAKALVVAN